MNNTFDIPLADLKRMYCAYAKTYISDVIKKALVRAIQKEIIMK